MKSFNTLKGQATIEKSHKSGRHYFLLSFLYCVFIYIDYFVSLVCY